MPLWKYGFNRYLSFMYFLRDELFFPPANRADHNGIVAIGGDLSMERLLLAYRSGIFPWYNEGEPVLWHSPDPRFVLFPEKLVVSKSMKQLLKQPHYSFTVNKDFEGVIEGCKNKYREGQEGTWITREMQQAYIQLHHAGWAVSAEARDPEGNLAGGLYGVKVGKIFCGESMFSKQNNASKFAFINFVENLKKEGCVLIDCQVYTSHLESLGAEMIPRNEYLTILEKSKKV